MFSRTNSLPILILQLLPVALGMESMESMDPVIAVPLSEAEIRAEILDNYVYHDFPVKPRERGTITILYSSIFLLVLSCYAFIRPNIPGPSSSEGTYFSFYFRKLKWICITLLFPEVTVHQAILQRWGAGQLLKQLNKVWKIDTEKGMGEIQPRFTLRQAWYVIIGGIVVDFRGVATEQELKRCGLPTGKVTLRPEAVMMLYEADSGIGIVPENTEIRDKDKESVIVNVLVYFQAIFLIASNVLRIDQGYARSVLEIRCLTQITYMFILFIFWGSKPVDILSPTLISGARATEIYKHISASASVEPPNKFLFTHRAYNLGLNQPSSAAKNHPRNLSFWLEHLGLFFAFGIFGVFNMAANYIIFPTTAERMLWKCACSSTIVGSTIPIFIRTIFSEHFKTEEGSGVTDEHPVRIGVRIVKKMRGRMRWVMGFMGFMAVWAVVARVLLLILPFTALREMVIGTFMLPGGSEFVPHVA